jgi:tetratricopeptide (TPR) repeat protein
MRPLASLALLATTLLVMLCQPQGAPAQDVQAGEGWVAKIVSVQGNVQARRAGQEAWAPVRLNETFSPGDMIRVGERSRAAVMLPNEVYLRLDQNTTITFNGIEKEATSLIDLLKGAVHFFSRVPRGLKVTTPFVNGTVEGTEFLVRVFEDQTVITVFEGTVAAANQAGGIAISPGQEATARAGEAPTVQVVVRPRDAVQWALYYPAILDTRVEDFPEGAEGSGESALRKSIERYRQGDLAGALAALSQAPVGIADPQFFTYRAGLLLTVGRVDEATLDIDKALSLDASNSNAIALQSVIAVVQNDKDKALELANRAVALNKNSAAALVARSYALQAHFNLEGALADIQEAVKLAPENALAWARLSDLWLSLGYLDKALDAATQAAGINPRLARTQVVLGYAYLMEIKISEAIEAFNKAIELDQADPLARLGLGLAKIRQGDLEAGRTEIEIAVSLDPNNSLIRSYLGKAYFDEKRDTLAKNQYSLAKELDPKDPTPWFYDAIEKLTTNRPVEALHDVQKSIELNDNRAVYRSKLLLDEDLAARSAALGGIYNDLGFQQLALVEGWKSTNTDPGNYSAHRLLADSYSALPRHKMARVSELLQSQLLQPLNVTPVQPLLAEANTYLYEGAGPTALSFNEFNPLFLRNRLTLQTSGLVGDKGTWGDEVIHSAVWGKVSYSIGQFHYETDGFRKNNDQDQDIYNAFGQVNINSKTTIQGELRYKDFESGDLSIRFYPNDIALRQREEDKFRSGRFGFHHAFTPNSEVIGSFITGSEEPEVTDRPNVAIPFPPLGFAELQKVGLAGDRDGCIGEIQHLFQLDKFHLISGAGYFNATSPVTTSLTLSVIDIPMVIDTSSTARDRIRHTNVYLYSLLNCPTNVTWTLGASGDFYYNKTTKDRQQFNPKFGLTWNPFPSTTIRAAGFRVLRRTLFFEQTIEPTQVAGFNQFFDDALATDAWRWGIGIDQKFTASVFGGVEFSRRYLDVPITSYTTGRATTTDWKEVLARTYLYWTPHPWISLRAEYQYERFEWDPTGGTENAVELNTYRVPLGISLFHPSGFSAMVKTTYVYQEGDIGNYIYGIVSDDSDFWVTDASISYRLPKRYGLISVVAQNLFDEEFKFQDTDSRNPSIAPERFIFLRFTLNF